MIKHSNFKRRWKDVKDDIIEGFNKIHANEKVVNGLYTEQVEQKLKTASKRKFAVLCRSGSHAITMSLLANVIGPGDKVLVPNYSCVAVLSSVMVTGCVPVFCEVDVYGSLDTSLLDKFKNKDIKAILASGLYGDVHDHDSVKSFCIENNVKYINDAAQSQFAEHKGTNSLELGDTVCMSFADNKCIPVAGTFGAMLTDNESVYKNMRHLRKNGKASREEGFSMAGYSSHPEEMFAVQILASWKNFDKWQKRKLQISKMYDEAFAGKIRTRPSPCYSKWNGHKYAILVNDKFTAYERLLSLGVETEKHYVDNFSKLKFTPTDRKTYPVTDMFIQKSLTLPNNPHMTNSEVDEVITKVIKSEY